MPRPFALLTTWTTYGTWLPGDARGYVSNTLLPGGRFVPRQNVPGTPYTIDHLPTRTAARARQAFDTRLLTPEQATCVATALVGAATGRGWRILRAAVMPNHVHVVATDCPNDGPQVRRVWKGVAQAALNDLAGRPIRWWTAGGSDRYKNDEAAIAAAVRYVAAQPGMLAGVADMRPFVAEGTVVRFLDPNAANERRGSTPPPDRPDPKHSR